MLKSRSTIATPPGVTIKEQLEDRDMTQKDFAIRMGLSEKHVSELINGKVQLTTEMARRLELVLGMSAQFWCNLESIYREKLAKIVAENETDAELELAKKYPYAKMARNKWVPDTRNPTERVSNLRKYFEVVKLDLLSNSGLLPGIAYRRMRMTETTDYALVAWAQKARLEARNVITKQINLKKLSSSLGEIRGMTEQNPAVFCPTLTDLMACCGIALIFLPHIKGSFLHGATFIDGKKIVMGLTVRGKYADKFWFSLFHEIGHVLHRHIYQAEGTSEEDESEADKFAGNTLIPRGEYDEFLLKKDFSKDSLMSFSRSLKIAVGILVGRLQNDGHIPFNRFNELKKQYALKS